MFLAGAMDLPFVPTRSMLETDIPEYNDDLEVIEDPLGSGTRSYSSPGATRRRDHPRQRCDPMGNAQMLGNVANDHLKARAAEHTIVTCEELVSTDEIRRQPELARIPFYTVDAVAEVPFGSHPWHCYGRYYADLPFYREYGLRSQDREEFLEWLEEWIRPPRRVNLEKVGADRLETLEHMERTINGAGSAEGADGERSTAGEAAEPSTESVNPVRVDRPDETADDYTTELLAVAAAREIDDGETAFIGVGMSLMSGILAKHTHAPDCQLVTESGYIGSVPPGVVSRSPTPSSGSTRSSRPISVRSSSTTSAVRSMSASSARDRSTAAGTRTRRQLSVTRRTTGRKFACPARREATIS